jgi:hypothetical protein
MLKTVHSGKHCSCYIQGEYLIAGPFGKKMVGGELKLIVRLVQQKSRLLPSWRWARNWGKELRRNLRGHVIRRGDKRSFVDHVNKERISETMWRGKEVKVFPLYFSSPLTMRFGEEKATENIWCGSFPEDEVAQELQLQKPKDKKYFIISLVFWQ